MKNKLTALYQDQMIKFETASTQNIHNLYKDQVRKVVIASGALTNIIWRNKNLKTINKNKNLRWILTYANEEITYTNKMKQGLRILKTKHNRMRNIDLRHVMVAREERIEIDTFLE